MTYELRTRSRYAASAVLDALTNPLPRELSDIPWRAEAITPEWLTWAVCSDVPGAAVTAIRVVGGHEGSSVRRGIEVAYNDAGVRAGLPKQLFAKTAPTWLTRLASSAEIASAESEFLGTLASELPIEVPRLVYSAVDRDSGRMIELFVDLVAEKDAIFFNLRTSINRGQAEQMVDTLAVVHGSFASRINDAELSWLPVYGGRIVRGDRNGLHAAHEQAMDLSAELVPSALYERRREVWPAVLRSVQLDEQGPRTLLHSDVHLGNWYQTGEGRIGLADWQCVSKGHWARDVAYAISSSLRTDDRRAWERDLLERYLDTSAKYSGVRIPSDEAWLAYRRHLVNALLSWTPTLVPAATMPDMQPIEMSELMLRRIGAAMVDLDTLQALSSSEAPS